jgi:uncharacterized protein (UPF0332 family)
LQRRKIQRHQTSRNELDELRALVDRDLKDAAITQLSADRRFAVAYNAVLQLAKMVLACEGYRASSKPGHHTTTLEAVGFILGAAQRALIDYFEACRRKRNQVNYDVAGVTSEAEAEELVEKAKEFRQVVEDWIMQNHSQLA